MDRRQARLLSKKQSLRWCVTDCFDIMSIEIKHERRSSLGGNEGTIARACLCRSSRGTANDHR